MASKETNNCPTSDRDGVCVDVRTNRQTIAEIDNSPNVFMPDAADILAREQRDKEYERKETIREALDNIDLDTEDGWDELDEILPDEDD